MVSARTTIEAGGHLHLTAETLFKTRDIPLELGKVAVSTRYVLEAGSLQHRNSWGCTHSQQKVLYTESQCVCVCKTYIAHETEVRRNPRVHNFK